VKIRLAIQLLILAALPVTTGAQDYTPLPEECFPQLGSILRGVEETAPRMRIEAGNVEESEAYLKVARSYRGLRISSFGRFQGMKETRFDSKAETDDDITIGPFAGVSASVPIYHWGEFDARITQAKSHIAAMKSIEKQQISQVKQEIRRNFIEYQLSSMASKLAAESIDYARQRHSAISGLVERGLTSPQSVADADIYEQEREEDLSWADHQSASAADMLKELTGDASLTLTDSEFPGIVMLDEAELEKLRSAAAIAYLPQVEQLDNELAAEEASYKEICARNRPKIDAVAGTNLEYTDEYRSNGRYESVPRLNSWAGVQASWTIYDNGTVSAEKLAALARQRKLKARIDEAKLRQSRQVSEIARDAKLNESRYQTRLRKLDLLSKTVSMMEAQMEDHTVSTNDFFQRKQELERTRLDLYRASAYYMLDIAQLRELASFGIKK
jgi:outer membrane protein TolC